jgi:glycosyltransferase involved in cell wall biosynthesis
MAADSTKPLVAVVTPVYNGARYLAEVMESVQAQTYANVVHCVLDNASTDATPDIIASFRDRRVPVLTRRNPTLLSMDENWNASLTLIPADAAYFRILCADDFLMPETTEKMVALAESDPEISVVTTAILRNGVEEDFRWPRDRTVFDGAEALRRYFASQGAIEARQAMTRRAALQSASPFFDLNVGHSADIDAALRMLKFGKLGYLHEPLIRVTEHADNQTVSDMIPMKVHFNDWLITLRRHGPYPFGDDYAALERRYWRFYLRRMLRWRLKSRTVWDKHMELLTKIGSRPSLLDFADAALDFALEKLGLREGWYAYPN